jgi:signal transduction histidine kinase
MHRLLPGSLFGRIVLILLTGLIVAQVGSALISASESRRLLERSDEREWSERLAGAVRLIDALPAEARSKTRGALTTRRLALEIAAVPAAPTGEGAPEARAQLSRLLGEEFEVSAWRLPRRDAVRYMVRLQDGQWLLLDHKTKTEQSLPEQLFWRLLILLGMAILLTLLATRAVLKPLRRFTSAAERLGKDLDAAPLPVVGARETREAARTLNKMQERIRESVAERTRLLAAISHDLRTPLTRLRLHAEFIREDPQLRAVLLKEVSIMQALAGSALEVLRGGQGESMRRIDINALLEGLASDFSQMGTPVVVTGHARAVYRGRSLALRRALSNLLDNAINYAPGQIEIFVHDDDTTLSISVRDQGPGIPDEEQVRMLEPFQRLEPSRNSETGGHGLGLAIAQSVARTHGGELVLRNRSAGGLEARLTLPRRGSL